MCLQELVLLFVLENTRDSHYLSSSQNTPSTQTMKSARLYSPLFLVIVLVVLHKSWCMPCVEIVLEEVTTEDVSASLHLIQVPLRCPDGQKLDLSGKCRKPYK